MKKVKFLMLLLAGLTLFTSCIKTEHSVRLKNDYPATVFNFKAGNADIGNVASGSTSAYKEINTGDFTLSGTTSNNMTISGSGSIKGAGKHKWTITFSSAGSITMAEDK